ncbi:MAG: restriction endonuclease subunit S [Nitrosomonas sp.]|uniref:restriction endonuclease subunit S n=1 Tax=Nitrosomonas sp. TaxID=42353 RepID=UPI002AB87C3D|nr:restriction endonuclease subunit S [Nitrosomonas sp.]MDZ4105696.1 restriction endonuclease subunit S [Nitrosomonas sp.]
MPNSWTYEELGEICKVTSGGTPRRDEPTFWDGEIPWVTTAEIKGGVIKSSAERITQAGIHGSSAKVFPINTVLVAMYGQGKTRGMSGILGLDASTNQACAAILPSKKLNPQFLFQYLNGKYEYLRSLSNLGGQQNLSGGIIKSLVVPIPPAYEQTKIVEILSTWDKSIEATERLLENSKKRKKALMQQLLTGKKRLPGFENHQWITVKSNTVFKTVSIKRNSPDEPLLAVTQDQGAIPRDMLDRRVVMPDGETSGYKLVEPGNFIISLRSFQGGLEFSRYRGLVSPAYTILDFLDKKKHSPNFFRHYFKSYDFIGHLSVAVIGIRDGKQISYDDFSFLKIPAPSIEEQEKIASFLDTEDRLIDSISRRLIALQNEKKSLMQQLLTGKKRVKVEEAA